MNVKEFLIGKAVDCARNAMREVNEALGRELGPAPAATDEVFSAKWKCESIAHSVSRALGSLSYAQKHLRSVELLLMEEMNRLDTLVVTTGKLDNNTATILTEAEEDPR